MTTDKTPPRVAVFPFTVESDDPEHDYFGEGLAAEILICLTRIQGIHLVARSSVFSQKSKGLTLDEIGRQLDATAVMRGIVRASDDQLTVLAQLTDVETGKELWSGRFERTLQDVFFVLDEIAASVASALGVSIAPDHVGTIQNIHTSDIDAYHRYLRGRKFFHQFSRHSVESALKLFREAVDIDETYSLAYCGIADCSSYLYMYVESSDVALEDADAASLKALELDPTLAEVHTSRGLALSLRCQFEESESSFKKAIAINSRLFEASYFYARVCFVQGKLEKALVLFNMAHKTRPEDYQSLLLSGQIYDTLRSPERAESVRREGIRVAERHLEFNPNDTRALYLGAGGLVPLGETDKALEWLEQALSLEPDDPMLLYNAGCVYALADKAEQALVCLEKTVAGGITQMEWYEYDSNLDSVREHPRFVALLDQMD